MRGKVKKEYILIGGIIVVLLLALGQLGMLINKTYRASEEEKEYVEISFNQYENVTVEVRVGEKVIKPNEEGNYRIQKGEKVSIHCRANNGYGIDKMAMDGGAQTISNIQDELIEANIEKDTQCSISVRKVYKVKIESKGSGSIKLNDGKEEVRGDKECYYFEGDDIHCDILSDEHNYIKQCVINESICIKDENRNKLQKSYNYDIKK